VAVSQATVSRHFPVCNTRPASGEQSDFALHNYCGIKSGAGDGRIGQQKTRLWPPEGSSSSQELAGSRLLPLHTSPALQGRLPIVSVQYMTQASKNGRRYI